MIESRQWLYKALRYRRHWMGIPLPNMTDRWAWSLHKIELVYRLQADEVHTSTIEAQTHVHLGGVDIIPPQQLKC